jgi:CRP-like cAMP-binding protein
MISPEILRRFPVFAGFDDNQLKSLAMIADEHDFETSAIVFEEGARALKCYLLVKGNIDLLMKSEEEYHPTSRRYFSAGEINPGEVFGLSAILDPTAFKLTAQCAEGSTIIEFDGAALQALSQVDIHFAYQMMHLTAISLMQRLYSTRVQLAAAWA